MEVYETTLNNIFTGALIGLVAATIVFLVYRYFKEKKG